MKKITLFIALLFMVSTSHAALLTFNFSQDGFEEGATVSGYFTGEDIDGNGQLNSFAGEVFNFSMTFSGNSLVSAFSLEFSDLWGIVYDLDNGPLGDGLTLEIEGIGADNGIFGYEAGPGPQEECGIGISCGFVLDGIGISSSQELIIVTAVPEPGTLTLIVLSLFGIRLFRK